MAAIRSPGSPRRSLCSLIQGEHRLTANMPDWASPRDRSRDPGVRATTNHCLGLLDAVRRLTVPTSLSSPNQSDSATRDAAVPALWETLRRISNDGICADRPVSSSIWVHNICWFQCPASNHPTGPGAAYGLRRWHVNDGNPRRGTLPLSQPGRQTSSACMQSRRLDAPGDQGPTLRPRIWSFIRSISRGVTGAEPSVGFLPNGTVVPIQARPETLSACPHARCRMECWAGVFARGSGKIFLFVTYFWGETSLSVGPATDPRPAQHD
jgi:hypothetical protein